MNRHLKELNHLMHVVKKLRDPINGCPWDIAQDFESIAPYTIEEAYEVADAIQTGNRQEIRNELGDLLLQVIFHSQIAKEEGSFDLADVARKVTEKMIERHPNVFDNAGRPSASEQKLIWEQKKAEERKRKGQTKILDGIALGLPPLIRAMKLQKRAATVGFDWPSLEQVFQKLTEEAEELAVELQKNNQDRVKVEEEVGDLLFVAVNLARKANIDPEIALQRCNKKFEKRFNYVEEQVKLNYESFSNTSLEKMESYWNEAKSLEYLDKSLE